jgi:hypothetical protein
MPVVTNANIEAFGFGAHIRVPWPCHPPQVLNSKCFAVVGLVTNN